MRVFAQEIIFDDVLQNHPFTYYAIEVMRERVISNESRAR